MGRVLQRSLLGQMLLAVAMALFVAQTLAGVLLYRAAAARAEAEVVSALAFQLLSDNRTSGPSWRGFPERVREGRRERRRQRAILAIEAALYRPEMRDTGREAALRSVMSEQDIPVEALIVLSDLPIPEGRDRRGRTVTGNASFVLAGLRIPGENQWRIAAHVLPPPERSPLRGVLLQTVILYVVLVGGLALLLRRITRPLAELTDRVERFGGARDDDPPMRPTGPEDTRRLIAAHNAMEARVAALLDEKDVMLGAIGHDLKTPLAALRVRIETVEDESERARMAAGIEDITRSLDDILSLARVGRPSDPLERTDLAALVASVVEEYEDLGRPVTFEADGRIAASVRATWLRRAIRNLVDNALRYGGKAHVTLHDAREGAIIAVIDDGPGIDADRIDEMLEPFKRGDASRNRETGGAGLGLTLARAIAEQHGGTLTLANKTDGTAVTGLIAQLAIPVAGPGRTT
ncbi:sensor histidine kinase [Aurantiacibacter spongiae]|uniref:histidine kinase n=1 Tax=Aurantiacibacter spongiae TaxID=2488860 RepID=A0A3N5DLC0_9SPHN|nr:HAMP domain-containing sensor histidine kinase [Aurantiacibacter spongiae]RPF71575.1 sensor histidine kinase [Aurantiacibacter spongiae]